ncbi:MAG TPA: bifunctional 5,10-methylenetetrahydrofolate dehydrogenase/5,10-methenyltetrahydrofolate cyclohydrolase [bacterium]|nr:bifunctional 5,10-methylenetetrahydrofolate dehydrogenase/5,10-methenyltetrahydrofolate cyclohydrolase [bacterium]
MSARILDGKKIAGELGEANAARAEALRRAGIEPTLAVLAPEGDPNAAAYARSLAKAGTRRGLVVRTVELPAGVDPEGFRKLLKEAEAGAHGVLVLRPLPKGLDPDAVDSLLDPARDVDGVHPVNAGLLALGRPRFVPATARAVHHLLKATGVELVGKRAVIIGRSNIVGKPLFQLLLAEHLTVTVCHSRTVDLPGVAREADVLAVAIGRAHMVTPDYVKPGAVVLDAGYNWNNELGREQGDVHPDVAETAGWFTPVPGGVGPVTTQMLLENALRAAQNDR